MTIVLNEHEWAKERIDTRTLGSKPFETLTRVARYYLDNEYSKKDTRRALETFLLQCDPTVSIPKWDDTLNYALNKATKFNSIKIDGIDITDAEIKKISKLEGKQIRRLAFTLLCLAKYWNLVNPNCDGWVTNKDTEIVRMANINTSIKRQSLMYHKLSELGMIRFSKKIDNTNVKVCYISEGKPVIKITDFRNLGYQYLKYCGEPYFECVNCGITTKMKNTQVGAKPKYCKECAIEVHTQQMVNSIMRRRVTKS